MDAAIFGVDTDCGPHDECEKARDYRGFRTQRASLARLLEEEGISYHALDMDPDRVQEAQMAGANVSYGDAARRESLTAAGINRAAALVVTYSSTASALKILHFVNELNPSLPVIVRSHDDTDLDKLRAAGATEVVPELMEGSLMLASHALVILGVPLRRVVHRVQAARDERYESLRDFSVAPAMRLTARKRCRSVCIR
jgi:CPA2 family monovalent cation:H+ antiporter-2